MKLRIVKNKDIAFSGFVRNVIHYGMYEWIQKWQKGPLKKVPVRLSKEASLVFNFHLSYERHPIKDVISWSKDASSLINKLEKIHDEEWINYKNRIEILVNTMNGLIKEYGNFILRTIPKKTKIPWKYDEVWIIPAIYYGSTTEDNKIFMGVHRSLTELRNIQKRVGGLIHELIHVNEQPKYLSTFSQEKLLKYVIEERAKFRFPNASRELATMVITNSIIKEVEKKFKRKLEKQTSHPRYKNLIKVLKNNLIELEGKKGFNSIRKAIDCLIYKEGLGKLT